MFNQKNIDIGHEKRKMTESIRLLIIPWVLNDLLKDKSLELFEPAITFTLRTMINELISEKFGNTTLSFHQLLKNKEMMKESLNQRYNMMFDHLEDAVRTIKLSMNLSGGPDSIGRLDLLELETALPAWNKYLKDPRRKEHFIELISAVFMRVFENGQNKMAIALANLEQDLISKTEPLFEEEAVKRNWEAIVKRFKEGDYGK